MTSTADELREEVRRRYAESALRVTGQSGGCGCGSGSCCGDDPKFGEALYDAEQRGLLPEAATLASLGCGNPTAVADLREGRRFSISGREAASTSSCPPSASGRPGSRTDST
ncbi:MAG TPA: hypothetical protein VGU02_08270 [Gaiellaceae bacterium]|nr:hypothetical protein [Gaiellaceae bacterium]